MSIKMYNKKGQVGETITWIVATVAIVVILMFFIFGSSLLGGTKSILKYRPNLISNSVSMGDNILLKKSVETASLITQVSAFKERVKNYLGNQSESTSPKVNLIEFQARVRYLERNEK